MPKFLVCYDLSTEKKRSKLRKDLKNLGLHLQWSVFEVETDSLEKLKSFLTQRVEIDKFESLMVFRVKKLIAKMGTDWEVPEYRI
jgi:CRISPR-associated endonuclease Cas2